MEPIAVDFTKPTVACDVVLVVEVRSWNKYQLEKKKKLK